MGLHSDLDKITLAGVSSALKYYYYRKIKTETKSRNLSCDSKKYYFSGLGAAQGFILL